MLANHRDYHITPKDIMNIQAGISRLWMSAVHEGASVEEFTRKHGASVFHYQRQVRPSLCISQRALKSGERCANPCLPGVCRSLCTVVRRSSRAPATAARAPAPPPAVRAPAPPPAVRAPAPPPRSRRTRTSAWACRRTRSALGSRSTRPTAPSSSTPRTGPTTRWCVALASDVWRLPATFEPTLRRACFTPCAHHAQYSLFGLHVVDEFNAGECRLRLVSCLSSNLLLPRSSSLFFSCRVVNVVKSQASQRASRSRRASRPRALSSGSARSGTRHRPASPSRACRPASSRTTALPSPPPSGKCCFVPHQQEGGQHSSPNWEPKARSLAWGAWLQGRVSRRAPPHLPVARPRGHGAQGRAVHQGRQAQSARHGQGVWAGVRRQRPARHHPRRPHARPAGRVQDLLPDAQRQAVPRLLREAVVRLQQTRCAEGFQ